MSKYPKYICKSCKGEIQSKYSGDFSRCTCGAIAIDSTDWYSRWIGDLSFFLRPDGSPAFPEKDNDYL